ncbi:MAG: AsmA-like C-terminal region-containing protein [Flavobacteriales bacterium]
MPRWLRRTLLITASTVVLVIAGAFTLATVYEDEVKARIIAELNKHLTAPVSEQGIELTLLKHFPQASLRLKGVLILEPRSERAVPDTLLYADDLYLSFSLTDLFAGNYTVEQVQGKQVKLYPGFDANGHENWLIWKTDTTSSPDTRIALNEVSFDGLVVRYRDARRDLEVSTRSRSLVLSGVFEKGGASVRLRGDAWLEHLLTGNGSTFADHASDLDLAMEIGRPDAVFKITQGRVMAGNMPLDLSLTVTEKDSLHAIDLSVLGADVKLKDLISQLPPVARKFLRSYAITGEADIALRYHGGLTGDGPDIELAAALRDATMKEQSTGTRFNNISGSIDALLSNDGTPKQLVVKDLNAHSGSGTLRGNLRLTGSKNASMRADLRTDMALADLLHFARIDTVAQASGRVKANLSVTGKVKDVLHIRSTDMRALSMTGTAEMKDVTLKLRTVRHPFEGLNAMLAVNGNDAKITHASATVQGSKITMDGTLHNLMPYLLFADQQLSIEARASSPHIDLGALLAGADAKASSKGDITLPAMINLDVQTSVDELVFEDFTANGITGRLTLHDRMLHASNVKCATAKGNVLADLSLDGRDATAFPLAVTANFTGIDVHDLFREFQDFGQGFIGYRHLKGTADAKVSLTAPLSPSLHLDKDKLVCVADLTISNGALIDHESMHDVAEHMRKNKLIAPLIDIDELEKRLANITFNTLSNQIAIKDGAVHVPAMLVKSNVMEIELSGTHDFDGRIDHHLNFRLNELLALDGEVDEFGPVEDDGTGLRVFLHMYGTSANPQFGNDLAAASARRKQVRQQETAELKSILKEELNVFGSKDAKTEPRATTTGQPKFTTEWEGDSSRADQALVPKERKPKGLGRLFKEEEEEKEQFKVE